MKARTTAAGYAVACGTPTAQAFPVTQFDAAAARPAAAAVPVANCCIHGGGHSVNDGAEPDIFHDEICWLAVPRSGRLWGVKPANVVVKNRRAGLTKTRRSHIGLYTMLILPILYDE